ncbi:MAG TPA: C40 family peptidase [Bacteroidales bacterium]|jgi:cell wall-associated NlpC family hydrolase|nr:C40 family peptidase [Bacteroidales bacterium]HOX76067.1 C40 family peptidase [Bacteroidales bacterium]HPM88943.1 C40 family peptidase [Bacteroidales bacterium]HQM68031.1 C40 family peptidase [Bacteroidales bacterium]
MKLSLIYKKRSAILLVFIFQLLISYCAKRAYPERVFGNIENSAESINLREFLGSGSEKELDTRNTSPDQIIETARQYFGVPHCMGGSSSRCMDCSGLLVAVFKKYGIFLPHNSEEQARYGKIITVKDELKKGDLVFFIRSYKTQRFITHSGIYLGNNEFIHTSSTNGVTITSLDDSWWKEKFIFGTRVFK